MNTSAIQDLIFRYADDELVIGHRNSEWTGLGPILEEDIAFSSMAQDEVGHAQALYMILHEHFGMQSPDVLGFQRGPEQFRSCHLVELPIGDYAFSLVRHVLYDYAEQVRLSELMKSSFAPLAELAKKLMREEKYHLLHARTWLQQLGNATPESNRRIQEALNEAYPLAFGMFEPTTFDSVLESDGIQCSEKKLEALWKEQVDTLIIGCDLKVPAVADKTVGYGGRAGRHSVHLTALLKEMDEVVAIDPTAVW